MLDRREGTTLMTAGLLSSALPLQARSPIRVRDVVLVHGLFADGSCWLDAIPHLQSAGLRATAVQNSLTTLEAAATEVRRVPAQQDGPAVLVDQSFAGTIIHPRRSHRSRPIQILEYGQTAGRRRTEMGSAGHGNAEKATTRASARR